VKTRRNFGNPHWIGPLASATGFGDEGRGFVCSLRKMGVPLSASMFDEGTVSFLRELASDFPEQIVLLNQAVRSQPTHPATVIVHVGGAIILPPPKPASFAVCRTMWETDGLAPEQVAMLNTYDEIWVPSSFNAVSFAKAGVTAPIVTVPEGVDSTVFSPDAAPLEIPGRRSVVFLSIFEWSRRKGPDVLLNAWAKAFDRDDDVMLVLRCYPRNQFIRDEDLTAAVDRLIGDELSRLGFDRSAVAPIVSMGRRLTPAEMPSLYAAADCYVSPTRGEGWGRPFMEAMAVGLPVIATRWSAPLEFLNDNNALLLETDGLEVVDDRMDVPVYRGQRWAAPSVEHLVELLRAVTQDRASARRLGERARCDIVRSWQWSRVAQLAANELERIGERLLPSCPSRVTTSPALPATPVASLQTGICTIVTRSYLPAASVLCASITEQHPELRPTVLVVDPIEDYSPSPDDPYDVIGVGELGISEDAFAKMALIYTPTELCCALKPWMLAWTLRRCRTAIYLDSDIWVSRRLDAAFELAAMHGLVLTPHICHPMPRDDRTPDETALLASGMFNLGFIALGPGCEEFLAFWKERLEDDGIIDPQAMRHGDQRWVDFVPGCFPHYIWRDPAANVAYWNLHERRLTEGRDGRFLIDGEPLAFFHFSGFDPLVPNHLSRYEGPRPRIILRDHPALSHLCDQYRARLFAAGYRRAALEPYGFAKLPSGEVLTPERRRAYRKSLTTSAAPEPSTPHPSTEPRRAATAPGQTSAQEAAHRHAPRRPLVSVLVPTRNRERFLPACVASILEQTYTNLEIIILDNGSQDSTMEIASSFARDDRRIRIERVHQDVGLIANHRRGISLASSELVKFVHDDDVLEPSAIERLVKALDGAPGAAIATSPRTHIDVTGAPRAEQPPTLYDQDAILDGRLVGDTMLVNANNLVGEASTVLFRRDLLRGSPYASFEGRTYHYLTDVSTWLVLLAKGPLAFVRAPLSRTRIHEAQDGQRLGRGLEALEWIALAEHAASHGWIADIAKRRRALTLMLSRLIEAIGEDAACELEDAQAALSNGLARLKGLTRESLDLDVEPIGATR
jgi:glycosyltransferase involved in cell wall biosynthesis